MKHIRRGGPRVGTVTVLSLHGLHNKQGCLGYIWSAVAFFSVSGQWVWMAQLGMVMGQSCLEEAIKCGLYCRLQEDWTIAKKKEKKKLLVPSML